MLTFEGNKKDENIWGLNYWWEKAAFVIGAFWFWAVIVNVILWTIATILE
jgi:hypothetical protein